MIMTYETDIIIDNYPGDLGGAARVEPYDDILEWVTLNELRTKLECRGPPMTILNNEMPSGDTGSAYSAVIYVDGGVPFTAGGGEYNWCIQTESGGAPSNLNFRNHNDTASINFHDDCANLTESDPLWVQSDYVVVSGTPSTAGSFHIVVFARDNNNTGNDPECGDNTNMDNCAQKSFVITISP